MAAAPASVAETLATRAGEAMELNDRYLNPQLGRIVRTLGFDRVWTPTERAIWTSCADTEPSPSGATIPTSSRRCASCSTRAAPTSPSSA
jgi:hypothetical protein